MKEKSIKITNLILLFIVPFMNMWSCSKKSSNEVIVYTTFDQIFSEPVLCEFEKLEDYFNIYGDYFIPAGSYCFNHAEIQFETNQRRRLSGYFFLNWGNFYTGKRAIFSLENILKITAHFSVCLDFTHNQIRFKNGRFQIQEWGSRIGYAFSTRPDTRAFVYWNNEDQELNINFRFHWIPNWGSRVYLVYNHLLITENYVFQTENRVLVKKMDYLFRC